MKKYLIFLTTLLAFASACNEDDAKRGGMAPVTEAECESFIGSVRMTWKAPADEDYYYTTVSWLDAAGQRAYKKVSRFDSRLPSRICFWNTRKSLPLCCSSGICKISISLS